jgi:riboflavin kinase / FMN adenylyltransferase
MISRAITTGNFDGCHLGHQKLFSFLKEKSMAQNLKPTVVSFEPHTRYLLGAPGKPALLTTTEEKKQFVESLGLDFITIPFTHSLTQLSFSSFVQDYLEKKLQAKMFVFGYDHRMGALGQGNYKTIVDTFPHLQAFQMPAFYYKEELVSSSLVRQALENGQIERANDFLGRPYRLSGSVVMGKQLGRKLGFPTVNIQTAPFKLIPKFGVYVGEVTLADGRCFRSVVNIGVQPSLENQELAVEAHLLNFSEDLYGMKVDLDLFSFIRPEQKFDSLEALISQIKKDAAFASKLDNRYS